jgi:cholesterol transport system auxiliary component
VTRRAPHRALWIVLPPLLLAGCTGSLFKDKTAPPTMYLLSATPSSLAESPGSALLQTDLAVLKPRVRIGLDTDRIAALYPDRRLDYFADVRWSGLLDEVLQDLAVQELGSKASMRNARAEASVFGSPYWLEIEVRDFQAEYSSSTPSSAPTVHVRFLARIGNSADRRILARFESDQHEVAADNRMSAIVDAYNRAAVKALAEIGSGAAQTLNTNQSGQSAR